MPVDGESYTPTAQETFKETVADAVKDAKPEAVFSSDTIINAIAEGFTETLADTTEQNIQSVFDTGYIENASGRQLSKRARELGFIRQDPVTATGVVEFSRNQPATQDYQIDAGTLVETAGENPIQYDTIETVTLTAGTTSVLATVESRRGGSDVNVGQNALTVLPAPPAGIGTVTNPEPVGDPTVTDTNGDSLRRGQQRETDTELRNRVLREDGSAPSASAEDIEVAINNTPGVASASVVTNPTLNTQNGLRPFSSEVIVQGGNDDLIGETLFETMSIIDLFRLNHGVFGDATSYQLYDSFREQDVEVRFSRPTIVSPTIQIDLVVTDDFVGATAVSDAIIEYTGGFNSSNTELIGLELGESLYQERVRTQATSVTGVRGATDIIIDETGDGTDDTTTDSDGLQRLPVAKNELIFISKSDIQVTTTAV